MEEKNNPVCCEPTPTYYAEKYLIQIEQLDFGYVVRVGCKSFVFENTEIMIQKLSEYLRDPAEKQKQFYQNKTI